MQKQVSDVIEAFRCLSERDQAIAYMEIDAIWKAPRPDEPPSGEPDRRTDETTDEFDLSTG
jgi:hypothetical protein